jgi:hypothetical protein
MADTKVNELCMTECLDSYSCDLSELIASLHDNSAIEKVRFAGEFLGSLSQQDLLTLLGQVGQLKSLKEIHFGNASIQASLLSKVVEAAKDLKVFSLGCVELEGDRDDFTDHQALTQLIWENFEIINKINISAWCYGALALMLEENHSLERLETPLAGDQNFRVQIDEHLNNNRQNNRN